MNKFPYLSKDRLGSQHPSPSGSPVPRAISFVAHVLPPSKLTPSNIPAVSPASPWPTLVTVTMLSGLAGLTAIVSSDSFRCRWLMSTLTGVAVPVSPAADAVGAAAAITPATIATTITGNWKRCIVALPPLLRNADGSPGITGGVLIQAVPAMRSAADRATVEPAVLARRPDSAIRPRAPPLASLALRPPRTAGQHRLRRQRCSAAGAVGLRACARMAKSGQRPQDRSGALSAPEASREGIGHLLASRRSRGGRADLGAYSGRLAVPKITSVRTVVMLRDRSWPSRRWRTWSRWSRLSASMVAR